METEEIKSETNGNGSGAYQEHRGGKFAVGNPGKPKGAVVKVSVKVREAIVQFLEDNIDQVQSDFKALKSPNERLKFISEILPYAAPKLSAVQVEAQGDFSHKIEITWNEPANNVPNTNNQGSNGELQGVQSGLPDNS